MSIQLRSRLLRATLFGHMSFSEVNRASKQNRPVPITRPQNVKMFSAQRTARFRLLLKTFSRRLPATDSQHPFGTITYGSYRSWSNAAGPHTLSLSLSRQSFSKHSPTRNMQTNLREAHKLQLTVLLRGKELVFSGIHFSESDLHFFRGSNIIIMTNPSVSN